MAPPFQGHRGLCNSGPIRCQLVNDLNLHIHAWSSSERMSHVRADVISGQPSSTVHHRSPQPNIHPSQHFTTRKSFTTFRLVEFIFETLSPPWKAKENSRQHSSCFHFPVRLFYVHNYAHTYFKHKWRITSTFFNFHSGDPLWCSEPKFSLHF